MSDDPTIAGYAAAQARLRAKTGRQVPFFTPTETVWPEDVPTDSEGRPLDPTVVPLASGFASGAILCNVAQRPVAGSLDAPVVDSPVGIMDDSSLVLITGPEEWAEVKDATECEVFEHRYKIMDEKPDQIGGEKVQRILIFVEKM